MAYRIDKAGSLRPPRIRDGRLRADAHLTRTGVFTYANPDGSTRREYRPAEEVFDPESLASFEAIPLTDDHPPAMLTPETASEYTRGSTGENVRRDGDHVASSIVVFDGALIAKMKAGKVDVSNGYVCDLDETPGVTPSGEKYDVIQRNIRGNHVAVVERGRAGSARVRMDGVDYAVMINDSAAESGQTLRLDEASMTLEDAMKEIARLKAELAKAKGGEDKESEGNPFAKKDAEIAALQARLDAAEERAASEAKARKDAADAHADAVKAAEDKARKDAAERLDVEAKAHAVLGKDADGKARDFSKAETKAIKLDVIKAVTKKDVADKVDAYIDARFDSAVEQFTAGNAALGDAVAVLGTGEHARKDAGTGEKAATRKMQESYGSAWKNEGK